MVMRYFQDPDDQKIRKDIENAMRKIALGSGNQDGSPRRFLEILGIKDIEPEESTTTDVGEI
jgi:hypothetical protein